MDSKKKREEIVALIDNIKDHSDRLNRMPHMPLLEVSAILSKINRLHENTVVLKYLLAAEQNHEDDEFGSISLAKYIDEEDDEDLEEEVKDIFEEDPESFESADDDFEQEDDDLEIDEEELELKDESIVEDDLESTPTIEEMEERTGMSSKADINEQYAEEQEDRSLSEQLKKQPIADLLTAIGLNERYLYANDLFGGDIEEFRKVIRVLNEFKSESEASKYFDEELRRTYGWENDNELAEALFLLIKRRFQQND